MEISGDTGKTTAKEMKDVGYEMKFSIKDDKTAKRISTIKNSAGEEQTIETKFTYDDQYFYGTEEEKTKDRKYYSYEYENGTIKLKDLSVEQNRYEVYKKK